MSNIFQIYLNPKFGRSLRVKVPWGIYDAGDFRVYSALGNVGSDYLSCDRKRAEADPVRSNHSTAAAYEYPLFAEKYPERYASDQRRRGLIASLAPRSKIEMDEAASYLRVIRTGAAPRDEAIAAIDEGPQRNKAHQNSML